MAAVNRSVVDPAQQYATKQNILRRSAGPAPMSPTGIDNAEMGGDSGYVPGQRTTSFGPYVKAATSVLGAAYNAIPDVHQFMPSVGVPQDVARIASGIASGVGPAIGAAWHDQTSAFAPTPAALASTTPETTSFLNQHPAPVAPVSPLRMPDPAARSMPDAVRFNTGGPNGQRALIYASRDRNGNPVFSSTSSYAQAMSDGKPLTQSGLSAMLPGIAGGQTSFESGPNAVDAHGNPIDAEHDFGVQYADNDPRGHMPYAPVTPLPGAPALDGAPMNPVAASNAGGFDEAMADSGQFGPETSLSQRLAASQYSANAGPYGLRRPDFAPSSAPGAAAPSGGSNDLGAAAGAYDRAASAPMIPMPTTPQDWLRTAGPMLTGEAAMRSAAARTTEAGAQTTRADTAQLADFQKTLQGIYGSKSMEPGDRLRRAAQYVTGILNNAPSDPAGFATWAKTQLGSQALAALDTITGRAAYRGTSWLNRRGWEGNAAGGATAANFNFGGTPQDPTIESIGYPGGGSTPWTGFFNPTPFPTSPQTRRQLALASSYERNQLAGAGMRRSP